MRPAWASREFDALRPGLRIAELEQLGLVARTEEFAPFPCAGGARRSAFKCLPANIRRSLRSAQNDFGLSLVNTLNDPKPEDDLARRDDLLVELRELARPSYDAAFLDFRQFRFES